MIDLKFLDMTKINFAFTDDEKLLDLSGIAIGLPKEEFKKIIDYNQQNLYSLWMERALRAKERIDFWKEKPKLEPHKGYSINGCKGMKKFSSRKTLQPIEWINIYMLVERKCMDYAKKFKKPAAGPLE